MADLLLIEDEPMILELLHRVLTGDGHVVTLAPTGWLGVDAASRKSFDLVLLDLLLPDMSGEDVLDALVRQRSDVKVLVLSSVSEVGRRVDTLTRGAVDVLAKPFANVELLARVRVRVREPARPAMANRFLFAAGLRIDLERQEVLVDGRAIDLSHREFVLLAYLTRRSGTVCTRQELLTNVWGIDFDPGTNIVDVYVRRLRAKLDADRIETARNVGYRLAEV